VLILVIFRIARSTRTRGLVALAFVATLPPIFLLLASGHFYTPWSWLPRIVMQFTAGALVCAAVRKLQPTDRARRYTGLAALGLVVAIVGILYVLDAHPIPKVLDGAGLVDILFVPLLFTLSIGAGSLPWLLSLRPIVYLGHISFSLYMVHELVHQSWNWTARQFELQIFSDPAGKFTVIGLIAIAFVGAALLYHVVEEPGRRWMRGMVAGSRGAHGRLQPINSAREDRSQVPEARAG